MIAFYKLRTLILEIKIISIFDKINDNLPIILKIYYKHYELKKKAAITFSNFIIICSQ